MRRDCRGASNFDQDRSAAPSSSRQARLLMSPTSRHGPPLIGALLRMPWERVNEQLLAGLHERGFTDIGAAHLSVLQWPGPDELRPSELAAQSRMSKEALNYLLGQLERLGYLQRRDDPRDQ